VSLLLSEAAVRWSGAVSPFFPQAPTAIVLYYADPNGPVQLTPNWQGYVSGTWTVINRDGFRDRLYSAEPASGATRVAILGDSYTMGDGVPLEASYPKQLETLLADRGYEVMNCGVSATNTVQQVEVLRRVLEKYQPRLVIVGYNVNDYQIYRQTRFDKLTEAGIRFSIDREGRVTLDEPLESAFRRAKRFVYEHSALYRFISLAGQESQATGDAREPIEPPALVRQWVAQGGRERSFKALEAMRRLCEARGSRFLVAVLPDFLDVSPRLKRIDQYPFTEEHKIICAGLRARGIGCVDLLPAFAGLDVRRVELNRHDRHFNSEGNGVIARALLRHLEEDGLVAPPTRSTARHE
jgi:lysophospholipase L1-like esterase